MPYIPVWTSMNLGIGNGASSLQLPGLLEHCRLESCTTRPAVTISPPMEPIALIGLVALLLV
jgi:hypothetical protein